MASIDYQPSHEGSSFQVVAREKKRKRNNKPEQEQPSLAPTGDRLKRHVRKKKRAWRAVPPVSQEEVVSYVGNEGRSNGT